MGHRSLDGPVLVPRLQARAPWRKQTLSLTEAGALPGGECRGAERRRRNGEGWTALLPRLLFLPIQGCLRPRAAQGSGRSWEFSGGLKVLLRWGGGAPKDSGERPGEGVGPPISMPFQLWGPGPPAGSPLVLLSLLTWMPLYLLPSHSALSHRVTPQSAG